MKLLREPLVHFLEAVAMGAQQLLTELEAQRR